MVPSPASRFRRPIGRLSFTVLPLLVASALLAACGPESTFQIENSDGLPWGVIFRASAAPTEVASGEEVSIVLSLENTNDYEISLRFPTTCTLLFVVEDLDGGRVFPEEGNECPDATAPGPALHIVPNQTIERRFTWTGVRESDGATEPAPPDDYRIFGAMFEDTHVRTPPRQVTIR